MKKSLRLRLFVYTVILLLPTLACNAILPGNGGDEPEAPTPMAATEEQPPSGEETGGELQEEPAPTAEPAATPTESGPVAIDDLQQVQQAVVQIIAEGSFVDPQVGQQLNVAGSGSGFIIDPSGIAVTNNHVVTGAALLRVHVGGQSEPLNARVLGVSECSDLAVIDIDGEGFPYLDWYSGDLNVGLDVYAAGFPLGDPEFTLTRGIISKADAGGETSWASIDSALEHDATINPGNSGGPLVTSDGRVVGVNYASRGDTNQYYAIARDEAVSVIEQLRQGNNVTSIGINGTAVAAPDANLYGIWVASVESGSPADQVGVEAGDIVTRLENLVLATDGTMSDYCDILRSRRPDDVMRIEVLRFATEEVLEGQLNGDPLVVTVDFSQQLGDEVADTEPSAEGGGAAGYSDYTLINDNSGQLEVEVPTAWADVDGSPWTADDGSLLGPAVAAAPDLESYYTTWATPGLEFAALTEMSSDVTVAGVLDLFDFSDDCTYAGRENYSDALYAGQYDVWENCGSDNAAYIIVATEPEDGTFVSVVAVQVVTDADLEALDHILDSFVIYR